MNKTMTTIQAERESDWHMMAAKLKPAYNDVLPMMIKDPFKSFLLIKILNRANQSCTQPKTASSARL